MDSSLKLRIDPLSVGKPPAATRSTIWRERFAPTMPRSTFALEVRRGLIEVAGQYVLTQPEEYLRRRQAYDASSVHDQSSATIWLDRAWRGLFDQEMSNDTFEAQVAARLIDVIKINGEVWVRTSKREYLERCRAAAEANKAAA